MTLSLLAARPVDFAIFFTMGGLWLLGAAFIVLVWRWVIRFDRREGSSFDPHPDQRAPLQTPVQASRPHATPALTHPSHASEMLGV